MHSINSNPETANEKLKDIAISGVLRKYRGSSRDIAMQQIDRELKIIEEQGSAAGYLAILDALNDVRAKPDEFWPKGTAAATMAAYSLGLSDIDPLILNPKLYPEFFYGIHGERLPYFELDVTLDLRDRLLDYYEKRQKTENLTIFGETKRKRFGIHFWDISANNAIRGFETDTAFIHYDTAFFEEIYEELNAEVLEYCSPQTYAEYVKCCGFSYGVGVWKENAETLIRCPEASFDDIIGTREDVYEYLKERGMETGLAFKITELVRKGKIHSFGWTEEMLDAMDEASIPIWYRISCEKIQYLMSRCQAMMILKRCNTTI